MDNDKTIRDLLPSEKAEAKASAEALLRGMTEQKLSLLREDFGKTFQTEHGKRVLAWIMERAGFGKVILSADKGGAVDPLATTFAAMELNFYLEMRKYIAVDVLQQIEYGFIKPAGTAFHKEEVKRKTSKTTKKAKNGS